MMNYVTMDYKYLNKVIDQIVRETEIDYDRGVIESPFFYSLYSSLPLFPSSSLPSSSFLSFSFSLLSLSDHCKDVYGLNDDEIEYVWKEYRETIIDKINNG